MNKRTKRDKHSTILPALIAAGSSLAVVPASALELGDVQVQSALGQPLRASIAYALGPNEQLASYCVTLNQARLSNGIPVISNASISVANGVISLAGHNIVREPLNTLQVDIRCPYAAKLSREFTLFIDPVLPATQAVVNAETSAPETVAPAPVVVRNTVTTASRAATPAIAATPIDGSTRYRVQFGDNLSEIAQRIENRPVGLWAAVAQIHAANPEAFIDNDPNRLKAGSLLLIPEFVTGSQFVEAPRDVQPEQAAATATTIDSTSTAAEPDLAPGANDSRPDVDKAAEPAGNRLPGIATPGESSAGASDSVPVSDLAVVQLPAPAVSSTPNGQVATIVSAEPRPSSATSNWVWLLLGGGIGLLAVLLVFGRRLRRANSPTPVEPELSHPLRRRTDSQTVEALVDRNYDLDDDAPTSENLVLDADLSIGTGFEANADMAIAEDFSSSSTTKLDLELPDETFTVNEASDTDRIAAVTSRPDSILDQELLPDDDDYDMSVIMDVTKIPNADEVTERDLKAVMIDSDENTQPVDAYTVDQEVNYQVLEQDYEDELTATQALNLEIEKAAAELTRQIDAGDDASADAETAHLPLATVTAIDATARLHSTDDNDDTDVVEGIEIDDTVNDKRAIDGIDDETAEMPAKPGKVDFRAS